jgi:hypothetical protein
MNAIDSNLQHTTDAASPAPDNIIDEPSIVWFLMGTALSTMLAVGFIFFNAA